MSAEGSQALGAVSTPQPSTRQERLSPIYSAHSSRRSITGAGTDIIAHSETEKGS